MSETRIGQVAFWLGFLMRLISIFGLFFGGAYAAGDVGLAVSKYAGVAAPGAHAIAFAVAWCSAVGLLLNQREKP